jgi:hypothetical protein
MVDTVASMTPMTAHSRPDAVLAPIRASLVSAIAEAAAGLPADLADAPMGPVEAQDAAAIATLLVRIDAMLTMLDATMADCLDAAIDETTEAAQ